MRPTLTIELFREGNTLRRKYHLPASAALGHVHIVDDVRDIGSACLYGELRGLDALQAVLAETTKEELRENLSHERLDGVGQLLFEMLFGSSTHASTRSEIFRTVFQEPDPKRQPGPKDKPLRVRILAHEPELVALPWQATMWRDEPLTQPFNPWTFEIVSAREMKERHTLRLPARVLVIAPELPHPEPESAHGLAGTTLRHVHALRFFFQRMHRSNDVRIVRRARETEKLLEDFTPNVVYFFGHGDVTNLQSRLRFADGEAILVRDVAGWLKKPHHNVDLVFLNACSSGQARWHSAWWHLREVAPMVITNVMDAFAERAAGYAQTFFAQWWEKLQDPVVAANVVPTQTENIFDWATAISHTTYDTFVVHRGPLEKPFGDKPEDRLDRDEPRALAYKHVSDLCKSSTQKVEAILCCGTRSSHVEKIAEQCIDYIESESDKYHVRRVSVRLPSVRAPDVTSIHFEAQLKQDFGFDLQKDLGAILLQRAPRSMGNAYRVLWLDWGVLKNQKKYAKDIEAWLVFVRDIVARACPQDIRVIASLAVEEESGVVAKLKEKFDEYEDNDDLSTLEFSLKGLEPLGDVSRKHIMTFLRSHACEKVDKVSRAIYDRTGGNYAETCQWLHVGLKEGWAVVLDRLRDPAKTNQNDADDV